MGDETGIAWTERTWNPWQGCHKISPGCKFCYMYEEKHRYGQDPATVVRSATATFEAPLAKFGARSTKGTPGAWKWAPGGLVFTCSWSDWFIEEADAWRDDAWAIIRERPDLTFQILTKRHDRIKACLPDDWGDGYPNVWLGVSVEDQKAAETRIPSLLRVPARTRFLSMEPLLGPVDLNRLRLSPRCEGCGQMPRADVFSAAEHCGCTFDAGGEPLDWRPLHWIILGGESGPKARACSLAWLEILTRQARAAGVATFVKQLGANVVDGADEPYRTHHPKGGEPAEWPPRLRVREFPVL